MFGLWKISGGRQITHRKEGRIEASLQLTEKAIGMYRGHFLGGETEQPWLVSIRSG